MESADYYIGIAVTILGGCLCLLFMAFMFWGTRIPGDDGKPQIIKFKGVELQTNSIVTILLILAILTVAPLVIIETYKYKSKPLQSVTPESMELFLHGRVEGVDGKPVEGATVSVTELKLNGQNIDIIPPKPLPEGEYSFTIPVSKESKIKLEIDKNQAYRKQSVIIQLKDINFNPVLPKRGE